MSVLSLIEDLMKQGELQDREFAKNNSIEGKMETAKKLIRNNWNEAKKELTLEQFTELIELQRGIQKDILKFVDSDDPQVELYEYSNKYLEGLNE